uniref:30S ribosomal protein S7 n=1 Tax=Lotharella vacuolata TaxID=74820 RepID=A0A140JZV1_9EUKA|nr:30S ribosomal protein S7 [Lotharella vacuolata]BAU62628.1 30S ribosomal protein S7 [Lotharella vacuolata]
MSRRKISKKRVIESDLIYENELMQLIINRLMRKGNKSLAQKILYKSVKQIATTTNQDPIKIIEQAILNITPFVEIKPRRVGGSTNQIPVYINNSRGTSLAIKWLFQSSNNKSNPKSSIVDRLSLEIINAANGIGDAIKKRDELHKIAEANKTISKYNVI